MSSKRTSDDSCENDLDMALATLIKNTRTTSRHVSLSEIAKWVDIATTHLGSTNEVADRIGLSTKMLRQFLKVKELAPAVREQFARRELDSVDMAVHLRMLSPKEQEVVGCEAARGNLNTADVRAVVEFRKEHADAEIGEIVERVISTRNIKQYVIEFVLRGPKLDDPVLLCRFEDALTAGNIVSLNVTGSIARIILNQRGRAELQRIARENGMSQAEAVNKIASGELSA